MRIFTSEQLLLEIKYFRKIVSLAGINMSYPTHRQDDDAVLTRNIERAYLERTEQLKKKRRKTDAASTKVKEVPAEELINIAEESQEELLRVTSVFPFNLFPDTISIDRQKVSITEKKFFLTANIISVKVSDVLNVESHLGPVFGTIRLYSKYFVNNFHEVNYLTRKDVAAVHRLLQGYMIAIEKEIDCSKIDKKQLVILLNELGQPSST